MVRRLLVHDPVATLRSHASSPGGPPLGREPARETSAPDRFPVAVHAHVPWSSSFPRAYQTHCRLAERHPIFFVERPAFSATAPRDGLRVRHPTPNLTVAEPVLSSRALSRASAEARVEAALRGSRLLEELPPAVHWLYRPEFASRLDLFADTLAVVYDCADGDAAAVSASAERELLRRADVVFTAGQDGFLSRLGTHPCVRFVESGVDFDHFHGGARRDVPADLGRISPPRVGFAGVLDGRVDFELLRRLAAERPWLSFVLLGPLDGIAPGRLPHAPNVYHLGPRPYDRRPEYFGGFAAGVLPYRTGRRAGFSPAELLEFLAAGKPVVSTPLPEVVRRYSDVVTVAEADLFSAALDAALDAGPEAAERGLERARAASWPRLVGEMEILVARVVQQRGRTPRGPDDLAVSRAG